MSTPFTYHKISYPQGSQSHIQDHVKLILFIFHTFVSVQKKGIQVGRDSYLLQMEQMKLRMI